MRSDYPGNDDDIDLWSAVFAMVIGGSLVALVVYLAFA